MHADPAQSETVPRLEAALGATTRHVLQLQNPVGTEVILQTSCNNPHNFTLSTTAVALPPFGEAEVAVDYLPSSLGTCANNMLATSLKQACCLLPICLIHVCNMLAIYLLLDAHDQ